MNNPKVSVILPTYNAAPYLGDAINSILEQTYKDFELIIINDGSNDDTEYVIAKYQDSRIRVISQINQGLPIALNNGILNARGLYLARQDADDISLPQRLKKQVTFLDENPDYCLVGSWTQIRTTEGETSRRHTHPTSNGQLQVQLLINNQFVHSSVMLRRNCLEISGMYSLDPEHYPPEDYDLWLRIANKCKVTNLPEVLIQYLELPNSISRAKERLIKLRSAKMAREAIAQLTSINRDDCTINKLIEVANGIPTALSTMQYIAIHNLISKIRDYTNGRFPDEKSEISKGIAFLRMQTHKALIKSVLNSLH